MFTTIAYAQSGSAPAGGNFSFILMMVVFFAIFYFLLIRPQQKRQKEQQAQINSLKAGDQVLLTSGMIATVDSVIDANTFMVNLGSGVKVRIVKGGISGKYVEPGTAAASPVKKK